MRNILNLSILITIIFSFIGCSPMQINPMDNEKSLYQYYNNDKVAYKVFGEYNNSKENRKKLQSIIKSLQKEYSKEKNTFKFKLTSLTEDEKYNTCNILVFGKQYGFYRNSIEKDALINRCVIDQNNQKKSYYEGSRYDVSLVSPDYLSIHIKIGRGRNLVEFWQKIQIRLIDEKLYFYMITDKHYMTEGSSLSIIFCDKTNKMLKDKHLTSINPIIVYQSDLF